MRTERPNYFRCWARQMTDSLASPARGARPATVRWTLAWLELLLRLGRCDRDDLVGGDCPRWDQRGAVVRFDCSRAARRTRASATASWRTSQATGAARTVPSAGHVSSCV